MANELDANLINLEVYAEILPHLEVAQSLSEKVLQKVDDRSYTYADVLAHLNAGLRWIAGKFDLPDLEHVEDVLTDPNVNSIPMPRNYQKKLKFAHSLTHNRELKIYPSLTQLLRWFNVLDQTGRIVGITTRGRHLHYQKVPSSAESIRLIYYRYPDRLETRQDKPEELPEHLVEPLLVHYACREIFSEIEDGMEGEKVNTDYHHTVFVAALSELDSYLGPQKRKPVDITTEIHWDNYLSG